MPAPANDNIANCVTLTPGTTTVSGSNVGATKEAGEGGTAGSTIWYAWWPQDAYVGVQQQIDTIGSGWDTYLGIWTSPTEKPGTATVTNITLVVQDDDAGGGGTSKCLFTPAKQWYFIQVGGWSSNQGTAKLNYPNPGTPSLVSNVVAVAAVAGAMGGGAVPFAGTIVGWATSGAFIQRRLDPSGGVVLLPVPGLLVAPSFAVPPPRVVQGGAAGPVYGPW